MSNKQDPTAHYHNHNHREIISFTKPETAKESNIFNKILK